MARYDRSAVQRQIAFDNMDVRAADGACAHPYSHFVPASLRFVDLAQDKWRFAYRFLPLQDHRAHGGNEPKEQFDSLGRKCG